MALPLCSGMRLPGPLKAHDFLIAYEAKAKASEVPPQGVCASCTAGF